MAEMHFNGSSALTDVIYNGTTLDNVYFNNTLVFHKIKLLTATEEKLSFKYSVNASQSAATMYYPDQTITLQHTPVTVTAISCGLGTYPATTINSDGLSGTIKTLGSTGNSGESYRTLSWNISNNILTIYKSDSATGASSADTKNLNITYTYYG